MVGLEARVGLGARAFSKPLDSAVERKQCRPLTAAAPRYRRMETKGDGRSGALVKLPPSPRALFFSAFVLPWAFSITMDSNSILVVHCGASVRANFHYEQQITPCSEKERRLKWIIGLIKYPSFAV